MNSSFFTSNSEEWETPQLLFDELNRKFDFQLDVCATAHNAKCAEYYTKETDGLSHPWKMRNWMNPPYGREIVKWVERANAESIKGGVLTVALLPARTDTRWFDAYCAHWHKNFIRGRLQFTLPDGKTGSAPFPSMIVYFGIER